MHPLYIPRFQNQYCIHMEEHNPFIRRCSVWGTLWCITTTFLCRPRYVLKHILFLRWIAVLASLQQLIYFQSSGPLCPWRGDWIEQLQMSTSGSMKTECKTKNHPNEVFKVNFYCNILFIMTVLQNMKICWIGDAWYIHQIWSISTFYLINQGGVFIFLQSNIIFIPSWASEHVAHFLRFFQHLYIL